ncbi:GntR family transcriptional regulator [Asticcacaulis sp. AC460]|uniref:GntR family transcriptional regulator n=1 Tax=Asticcacaulis sp. AC460 TaxID=1282360 RepID=UPI0003C3D6BF|nr:GntR family transcriptional regulator [Asticcacaulis sp. AC460]ESQ89397.1 GntR family transcriptional regulator [Asticcacaulis sp. AC460]
MSKPGAQVLVTLRQKIASGELPGGTRLAEIPTAEALGVSRMPVRMALRVLAEEGLLVKAGARGYTVRSVTLDDIIAAVEVRGVLEGLAALRAAERGLDPVSEATFRACLAAGDALFAKGYLIETDIAAYEDLNIRFHDTLLAVGGSQAIREALARNDHLPFASVKALAVDKQQLAREFRRLNYAHMQHHAVYDALMRGQGARAEAIMREHANATLAYTDLIGSELASR